MYIPVCARVCGCVLCVCGWVCVWLCGGCVCGTHTVCTGLAGPRAPVCASTSASTTASAPFAAGGSFAADVWPLLAEHLRVIKEWKDVFPGSIAAAAGDHDIGARAGQGEGKALAQSTARTADEGGFSGEIKHEERAGIGRCRLGNGDLNRDAG